ncbi:hypothetical protein NTGZN8_140043 [Candidatus Nitrotoga fabula]|uniref:Uncharacterized protein n=1 Tax=Candidatus Nitrotoga fabula TaxID=2182327 RepID=A0A916BB36_9PROT|nr:hypothetical protein NTGZN8_140043 [Candidatus Nitrotoga fabula]
MRVREHVKHLSEVDCCPGKASGLQLADACVPLGGMGIGEPDEVRSVDDEMRDDRSFYAPHPGICAGIAQASHCGEQHV